jgi:hypothetical protein
MRVTHCSLIAQILPNKPKFADFTQNVKQIMKKCMKLWKGELVSSPLVFNIPTDIQFKIVKVRLDAHASYIYQVQF